MEEYVSISKLQDAKELLKECVIFMNKIPNNKYANHYELCSKIDEFLTKTE